jgi:hypothetical protein
MSCKLFPAIYIFLPFTPFLIGPFKSLKEEFYCNKKRKRGTLHKGQEKLRFHKGSDKGGFLRRALCTMN